jgi:flagellar biogenesis protein FliO
MDMLILLVATLFVAFAAFLLSRFDQKNSIWNNTHTIRLNNGRCVPAEVPSNRGIAFVKVVELVERGEYTYSVTMKEGGNRVNNG